MTSKTQWIRGVAALGILSTVALAVVVALPVRADDRPGPGPMAQRSEDWAQMRLTHMADRLEIKASQQTAWQEYAAAFKAAQEGKRMGPPPSGDAAAVAKAHADHASAMAAGLNKLADATAKLQQVLTPAQRQTLDQMSMPPRHRHDPEHCDHDGGPGHDHELMHERMHGPGPGMN